MYTLANAHKDKVKLTFHHGAQLPDPKKLFNAGLDGNKWRAIDFCEGDKIDKTALKALLREAVAYKPRTRCRRARVREPSRRTTSRRRMALRNQRRSEFPSPVSVPRQCRIVGDDAASARTFSPGVAMNSQNVDHVDGRESPALASSPHHSPRPRVARRGGAHAPPRACLRGKPAQTTAALRPAACALFVEGEHCCRVPVTPSATATQSGCRILPAASCPDSERDNRTNRTRGPAGVPSSRSGCEIRSAGRAPPEWPPRRRTTRARHALNASVRGPLLFRGADRCRGMRQRHHANRSCRNRRQGRSTFHPAAGDRLRLRTAGHSRRCPTDASE